uniref:Secreted protein n=1 Tax=Nelumbo nucifera TaxID=4432 RepID=A0A822YN97_NELNU|nr:TPA_asm: hypothetical protein HUJ06_004652 [Nelumbo nucifera]
MVSGSPFALPISGALLCSSLPLFFLRSLEAVNEEGAYDKIGKEEASTRCHFTRRATVLDLSWVRVHDALVH